MISILAALLILAPTAPPAPPAQSEAPYRLPYADGTRVKVFDDFETHRPVGRTDLFAVETSGPVRVVAAAAGKVVAIQDGYSEVQSGRAAKDCRNNHVWIAHPNGEWTNYSHMAAGSTTGAAGLKVGDAVAAGQVIGIEGSVGCSMLNHVHFEVVVPPAADALDEQGFLRDNAESRRERRPRFCGVPDGVARKDAIYVAQACR
jgi:murein DD-endopeptidase MepM/ murein hydrolase activator NlpD